MRHHPRRVRGQGGYTTGVSLVAMAVSLVIVAVLVLVSTGVFSGSGGPSGAKTSIVSNSSAETQLKLCSEGRDSTYGDPPTPGQQAKCLNQLIGQVSGSGLAGNTAAP